MLNQINEYTNNETVIFANMQTETSNTDKVFSLPDTDLECPYSYLAQDGVITYNGVSFVCDENANAITLGDMTDASSKIIKVQLSGGGWLKVNTDNLDELSEAIGMFSAKDQGLILKAISAQNRCKSAIEELEEEENKSSEENVGMENTSMTAFEQLSAYKSNIYNKIINNDTDVKYAIGGSEYSIKEWNKLIKNFDKAEKSIQETVEEEKEKLDNKDQ